MTCSSAPSSVRNSPCRGRRRSSIAAGPVRASLRALWGQPDFRRLWLGQSISMVGDRLALVALALLIVGHGGSAGDVGIVFAAQTAPLVLLLLVGGVWADRLSRQRLIAVSDTIRAILHGALALLLFTSGVQLWQLAVIEACFGAAQAFFAPAYSGLLPRTVDPDLIQQANALSQVSMRVASLLGPALATVIVVTAGSAAAFAVDAVTFLASAVAVAGIAVRAPSSPAAPRRSLVADLRAGYGHVRERTWVWVTIAVFSVALVAGFAPYMVVGPLVATAHYGSVAAYGVLVAVLGAGTLVGAVLGLSWQPLRPLRAAFLAMSAWPGMLACLAAGVPFAVLATVAAAAGCGLALSSVWWETELARHIPPDALSRVSAYDWLGSLGLLPLGYVASGLIAASIGAPAVLACGAAVTAVVLACGLLPAQTRRLAGATA